MNLLLINFDFPPNPGIGGRRWAKLAKAMARQGHIIHVVRARYHSAQKQSTWNSDVASELIHVYEVDCVYPSSLLQPPSSLSKKLQYRLDQLLLKLREKGNIYDKSIGWDNELLPLCGRIIEEENVDCIIATGAPWNILVYAAQLKQEYPECKLLVDYRDPWLTAVNYGMQGLSKKRKQAETDKQSFVFQFADLVTTPNSYITNELETWCRLNCERMPVFKTVEHFFDPDDYTDANKEANTQGEVRIVYAGDVYVNSQPQWQWLKNTIQQISPPLLQLGKKLRFDLYTTASVPEFMLQIPNIFIHEPIGKAIYSELEKADILLIVLPDNKKNERTTKFFEYLPYRKPLFVVADIGDVTDFVGRHKLGVHIHAPGNQIIDLFSGKYFEDSFNMQFDIETCTSNERASQIIKLLA
jgi:hypothetical protein